MAVNPGQPPQKYRVSQIKVKIQIQPSYPLNSSILAQSTVRFGSICVKARSSGEKLTVFANLYANTDFIPSSSRDTIESNTLT